MTAIALMLLTALVLGYPLWTTTVRLETALRERDRARDKRDQWKAVAVGRRHLRGIDGGAS